jgi:hypothetical protein
MPLVIHGMPCGFVLKGLEHFGNLGAGFGIGAHQISQDYAYVAQFLLGDGFEQIR